MTITASIVLYKQPQDEISRTVEQVIFYAPEKFVLFLVDNSPTDELRVLASKSDKVQYRHNPSNPGFGAAHNLAILSAIDSDSSYHFVINPDVELKEDVFSTMVNKMESDPHIGMMMPQILNEDGTVQNLPKLLPSPFSVLMRKLKKPGFYYEKFINRYELRFVKKDMAYNAPVLSGCFTMLRLSAIKEIGMYDDRFFMYFEDWDLSRRMHERYKTMYYPKVSVIHGYESGANKSSRLFKIFVNSATRYFNKWGWFFDSERDKINNNALKQFL